MAEMWQSKHAIVLAVCEKFVKPGTTPEQIVKAVNDETGADQDEAIDLALLRVGLRMAHLAYGPDYFAKIGAPAEIVAQYQREYEEARAQAAAKHLGLDDWRPLLIRAMRTPEQEKVMEHFAGMAAVNRFKLFVQSNYVSSVEILVDSIAAALDTDPRGLQEIEGWETDMSEAIGLLNRYFYVKHSKINPADKAQLSGDDMEELEQMARQLVAYRKKYGGGFFENVAPCFNLDNVKAAQTKLSLTQLPASEFFYEPTSKPNTRMHAIAAAGREGQPVNVGRNKPGATQVIVDAAIYGENGETITIDGFEREIQNAIGNMIIKNNGIRPIIVTPDQIYRELAQLESSATVTEQQREEVVRAMDKLIKAQARLDFSAQLQAHTHIEKQPDFDYEAEGAGRLSGPMIVSRKTEAWWNGENVGLAYIIYDYPMYFLQAHAVHQTAAIRGELLRLMDKSDRKTSSSPGTQNRKRDLAIKRYLLRRIAQMRNRKGVTRRIMIKEIIEDNITGSVSPKVERTLREKTEILLKGLKGQEGGIKDYMLIMRGRKITGFTIIL